MLYLSLRLQSDKLHGGTRHSVKCCNTPERDGPRQCQTNSNPFSQGNMSSPIGYKSCRSRDTISHNFKRTLWKSSRGRQNDDVGQKLPMVAKVGQWHRGTSQAVWSMSFGEGKPTSSTSAPLGLPDKTLGMSSPRLCWSLYGENVSCLHGRSC